MIFCIADSVANFSALIISELITCITIHVASAPRCFHFRLVLRIYVGASSYCGTPLVFHVTLLVCIVG